MGLQGMDQNIFLLDAMDYEVLKIGQRPPSELL